MSGGRNIWVFLLALTLAACQRPTPSVETVHAPSQRLVTIDTLMQSRPDSALTLLLDSTMDDPYYQLLLSEALYKNDYAQTNRDELLAAMAHFDSIRDPFLSARCHYMIGVGYYEMDSVVPACEEYMKAIQIMEEHYSEKELVGLKTKYLALAYTHLCLLFSGQYLHEQAIYFGKQALPYYYKYEAEPWHVAWVLDEIGLQYETMEQIDSAETYFHKMFDYLPDTTGLAARDLYTHLLFLSYTKGSSADTTVASLKKLLSSAENEKERLSRCLTIGEIYFQEQLFDSAMLYLSWVYEKSLSIDAQKLSAEWLMEICKFQGNEGEAIKYATFLAPFANDDAYNGELKTRLSEQYASFAIQKQITKDKQEQPVNRMWTGIFIGLLILVMSLPLFYHTSKRKNNNNDKVASFYEEPICRSILEICNNPKQPIKSTIPVATYADIALTTEQKAQLNQAIMRHFGPMFEKLRMEFPELKEKDLLYCSLCLLGLNNIQIAALLQNSHSTIWEREKNLQRLFGCKGSIAFFLNHLIIC